MKTVFFNIYNGEILLLIDGVQDMSVFDGDKDYDVGKLDYILIDKNTIPPRRFSQYMVVNNQLVKKM